MESNDGAIYGEGHPWFAYRLWMGGTLPCFILCFTSDLVLEVMFIYGRLNPHVK